MKYDVFISYSRKDTDIADKICKVFTAYGISYFIDRRGIGGGMEFPKVLASAIKESEIFLFLASENSYASKFTNSEVTYAFNKKDKDRLLPYVIDSSVLPDDLDFVFSCINIRNLREHPIQTVLVDDILKILNRPHALSVQNKGEAEGKVWNIGDVYDDGNKIGVVFSVDKEGKHGKILNLAEAELRWCTESEYRKDMCTGAFDENNGYNNFNSIKKIYGWTEKYPAFEWCSKIGPGWYLPAINELKELLLYDNVRDIVNNTLARYNGVKLFEGGEPIWYWSSTQDKDSPLWATCWGVGIGEKRDDVDSVSGYNEGVIRAISVF